MSLLDELQGDLDERLSPEALALLDPIAPNPAAEIAHALAGEGWALVHARSLDDDVVWYREGCAHLIPPAVSKGRICYRDDEIVALVKQRLTPEQLRDVHAVKTAFPRSHVVEGRFQGEMLSVHVGVVWEDGHNGD